MPRPLSYFTRKRPAIREHRRREKARALRPWSERGPPTRVWLCVGGYLGRTYYVGVVLPTKVTNSTAVTTLIAAGEP
jgi:hypothetical protein